MEHVASGEQGLVDWKHVVGVVVGWSTLVDGLVGRGMSVGGGGMEGMCMSVCVYMCVCVCVCTQHARVHTPSRNTARTTHTSAPRELCLVVGAHNMARTPTDGQRCTQTTRAHTSQYTHTHTHTHTHTLTHLWRSSPVLWLAGW